MEDYSDLSVLLALIAHQIEALNGFVTAYAEVDPLDTSPAERQRLVGVHNLLSDALDRFS